MFHRKRPNEEPENPEGQQEETLSEKDYMMLDAYMAFGKELANAVPQVAETVKVGLFGLFEKYYADGKRELPEGKVINLGDKSASKDFGMLGLGGGLEAFTGGRLKGFNKRRPF